MMISLKILKMTVQYRNISFTITDIETTNVSKAKSQEKASLEKKIKQTSFSPFCSGGLFWLYS